MKRLVFVAKDAGWQKYRMDVLNRLASDADLVVDVLTGIEQKDYIKNSERVRYHNFRSMLPIRWKASLYPGALWYVAYHRPDVVLALPNASQLTEFMLLPLTRLLRIRLVYWTHGYDHGARPERGLSGLLNRLRVAFIEFALRHADALILFSPAGRDYLSKRGVALDRMQVAPNTLNTDELISAQTRVSEGDIRELRSGLGVSNDTRIALFSGRLRAGKKVKSAIEAFALGNYGDTAVLVIVGDGEEAGALRAFVQNRNISNVLFLGAKYEDTYLATLFSTARLLVIPGYVGLAIVHAFCHGVPIVTEAIATHSPEIMYLDHGRNGFLVPEDDIASLHAAMDKLLFDDLTHQRLSHGARATAQLASIANMVRAMKVAILTEVPGVQ